MRGKNLEILFTVLTITIAFQGCAQSSESDSGKKAETNQSVQYSNINTEDTGVNTSNNFAANNPSVLSGNLAPPTNKKNVSKMPEPKIGSGSNDLAIIAMARGKLSSDKELLNNVIVEVRAGNATLNGTVASEEQKKKAEELIKSVEGIKNVKNNLRVSP